MSEYREISLRELQLMENNILIAFSDFCEKNELNYTLVGGTLLGAVRHKGFIPWDDDIDVGMPRPDYERFLKLTKEKQIAPNLCIISGDYGDLSLPFAKVMDANTHILDSTKTHESDGDGLWIDVFPVDGAGASMEEAEKTLERAHHFRNALGRAASVPWKRRKNEKGLKGFLLCAFRELYHLRGYEYYKKKLIETGKTHDLRESEFAAIVVFGQYGRGEIIKKDTIEPYVTMKFENRDYQVFGCWKEYLQGIYGDYMKLPPEKDRNAPHDLKVLVNQ